MDLRQVTVYIRQVHSQGSANRTVTVALDGVDVKSRGELIDRGFIPEGDSAVIEIVGDDADRVHQVLKELELWIVSWAEKQGAEPIFRWRVIPR